MTKKSTPKLTKAAVIFGILVIATCGMIFFFSSENSVQSSITSGRISGLVAKLLFPDLDSMPADVRDEITTDVSHAIRKCAHFTEYLLLAQFSFQLLMALLRPRSNIVCGLGALAFSAIYAMTDEYHQSFVPGRAMAAKDVLIDSSGGLLGVFLTLMVRVYIEWKKKKAGSVSNHDSAENNDADDASAASAK
ncbi:MAG: VanZ family protein [Ruminococcus sp.]|nr:VanZ family protein [Ruminococcus sp.]